MPRFLPLLLLTTTTVLAQTSPAPKHRRTPPADDDKWLDQVRALENRASHILKSELSRKLDPGCDLDKLSNADFGNCFAADEAITERNYRDFVAALRTALAIQMPGTDPKIFPPASKNFAAGEAAWLTYVDKTCAALGDTYEGGSGSPIAETGCQQKLTQQHMKDLNEIFLEN